VHCLRSSRPREASSDGTCRHAWPALHRLAALRRAALRVSPGTEAATNRSGAATGRTPVDMGRDDDGARERRRRGCCCRARVQAPEPRRTGPSASLGDEFLCSTTDASCHRKIGERVLLGSICFVLLFPCMLLLFFLCLFVGGSFPVTRVLCFNNSMNLGHCYLERKKKKPFLIFQQSSN
jgi:hypothetical protein